MNADDAFTLLSAVWPQLNRDKFRTADYSRLIDYHDEEISKARNHQDRYAATSTIQMANLITRLAMIERAALTKSKAIEIARDVLSNNSSYSDGSLMRTIQMAVAIQATIVLQLENPIHATPSRLSPGSMRWDNSMGLYDTISSYFELKPDMATDISKRINPAMTVAYLAAFKNIRVIWTSNLADHLKFDWNHRLLTVYEHKICLLNHLELKQDVVLPRRIIEEAFDTFNLLFPLNDEPTRAFLETQGRPFYGLGYCNRGRHSKLEAFYFWRDRLLTLVEIMTEEPKGLQQLVLSKDGKNLLHFATFWTAIVVAILTIISIVFGTVQTVYSVKQYNLAVVQACSTSGGMLPQYCS